MKPLRVYLDTSVVGGCCDDGFAEDSLALLEYARQGHVLLLLSSVLYLELENAPEEVRLILNDLPDSTFERINTTDEASQLRDLYLAAGVIGAGYYVDALHVATATVHDADLIASWNFKHMVHIEKIRAFSAVNIANGYRPIDIRTPKEIAPAEETDDE